MAVPPDRDARPVREFRSFSEDLEALATWLKECGVDIVAMESTGVYWIPGNVNLAMKVSESQHETYHIASTKLYE